VRIIDLRSAGERLIGGRGATSDAGIAGRLLGRVADALTARRVAGRAAPTRASLVVSIGNLRVGGTGKTPVVAALARDLGARGVAGCVVTRGYGSSLPGPVEVHADLDGAGDEARLLAGLLSGTGWTVIQSRDRRRGVAAGLARRPAPRVIILEDAHQTAGVGRHLDVLILDRWRLGADGVRPLTGSVVPLGAYRETAAGADRAGVWLLEEAQPPADPRVAGFTRRDFLQDVGRGLLPAGAGVGLVCGLARPQRFEETAARLLDRAPLLSVRCADHCRYGDAVLDRVLSAGRDEGVTAWLTTTKDWVKLAPRWPHGLPVAVAAQDVAWTGAKALPDLVEERLGMLAGGDAAD
jgi:tetraacyldisaccharide 4'-kinase